MFDGDAGEEGVVFGVAADIEDVDGRVRSACHLLGENFEFTNTQTIRSGNNQTKQFLTKITKLEGTELVGIMKLQFQGLQKYVKKNKNLKIQPGCSDCPGEI